MDPYIANKIYQHLKAADSFINIDPEMYTDLSQDLWEIREKLWNLEERILKYMEVEKYE